MPNWKEILNEVKAAGSTHDIVRRQYLHRLHQHTGRNVIAYYSGWLQKQGAPGIEVNDEDKNGFMAAVHEMDRSLGLDLVLHTPGGDAAATESLVDYLRAMFGCNIRTIVPQLAMSAGTMIACACQEIVMGKGSSLGPVDPQIAGVAAHGIVEEFRRAVKEVSIDPRLIPIWQPIIAKYSPTLIGECEKAMDWSAQMTSDWLRTNMFKDEKRPKRRIDRILRELGDHALTKSHARHLSVQRCREIGLKIVALEDDQGLQEAVLSAHHACMLTLNATPAVKIIENHKGVAFMKLVQIVQAAP